MNIFDWLFPRSLPFPILRDQPQVVPTLDGRTAYLHAAPGCWTIQASAPHGVCVACGSSEIRPVQSLVELPQKKTPHAEQKPQPQIRPVITDNLALYLTSLSGRNKRRP